MPYATATLKTT